MKRFHIHVAVENLEQSIGFYSALFGAEPTKQKPEYAKWMLDDPRINFAISARGAKPGLEHLGIQVDAPEELDALCDQMKRAKLAVFAEGESTCCYAKSDKAWVKDPSGIAWETYHTMADVEFFNNAPAKESTHACGTVSTCGTLKVEARPVTSCAAAQDTCC